jgi:hypothetical protein
MFISYCRGLFVFFNSWLAQLRSTLHRSASLPIVCLHTILSLLSASPLVRTRWKPNVTMHIWWKIAHNHRFLDFFEATAPFTVNMNLPMKKCIWLCYRSYFSLFDVYFVLSIAPLILKSWLRPWSRRHAVPCLTLALSTSCRARVVLFRTVLVPAHRARAKWPSIPRPGSYWAEGVAGRSMWRDSSFMEAWAATYRFDVVFRQFFFWVQVFSTSDLHLLMTW